MLAPILAFTADEAWEFVPGRTVDFANQLTWQPMKFTRSVSERQTWKQLFAIRETVLPALEKSRQLKQIGKALEAKVIVTGPEEALAAAKQYEDLLRELLNVSQLELSSGTSPSLTVTVSKAAGEKCERCWHWETDVGSRPEHPTICLRCVKAVEHGAKG